MSREYTAKLLDLADEGVLDFETIARAALNWLSEHEVEEMCHNSHDISELFPEEEEEEEDDDETPDPDDLCDNCGDLLDVGPKMNDVHKILYPAHEVCCCNDDEEDDE